MKLARIIVLVPLSIIILTAPAAAQSHSSSEYTVSFLGRVIDLEPYYQGFPYRSWRPNFDSGKLFYFQRTSEGDFLLVQDLVTGMGSGQIDAEQGRRVHAIDWSTALSKIVVNTELPDFFAQDNEKRLAKIPKARRDAIIQGIADAIPSRDILPSPHE